MNIRALLDADMQSIGRALLQGWQWWLDELRGLFPSGLRPSRRSAGMLMIFDSGALIGAVPAQHGARAGARATILVRATQCLTRTIERPPISERDLAGMIAFEADALLPIPTGAGIFAARVAGPGAEAGRVRIELAALPLETAQSIAVTAEAERIAVLAVRPEGPATSVDFAPAMRRAGILARHRSAAPLLWGAVAALVLCNLALWIWRDVARVDAFAQIVQEQQPALTVSQTIASRTAQDRRLVARSLALRRTHDPLRVLAVAGDTLPPGVWLQRFVWDGSSIRLIGYRPTKTDVATALRRSGRFADVRAMGEEVQATVPTGEPFDLSARPILP